MAMQYITNPNPNAILKCYITKITAVLKAAKSKIKHGQGLAQGWCSCLEKQKKGMYGLRLL